MTCVSPPELDELDLAMFLEGDSDERVSGHLARCPHCRQRARHLARAQNRLKSQLHRVTCPSPDTLRDYTFGLLSRQEGDTLAGHLARCPHCSRELAQLNAYLDEPAPGLLAQITAGIRILVARLVDASSNQGLAGSPGWMPVPAGVRGSEEEVTYVYVAGDLQIALDVQADAQQPDRQTLLGLVVGWDGEAALLVDLWRGDRLVASKPVDKAGNFTFADLSTATYELILRSRNLEIQIPHLAI